MAMTYQSLVVDIQVNAQRNNVDFVSQISNFIERAITRIYTEANNLGLETIANEIDPNFSLVTGRSTVQKRPNWKKTLSFSYLDPVTNNLIPLLPVSLETAFSYWPNAVNTETPLFYTHYNQYSQFYITPTPNITTTVRHIYVAIPLFNTQNPTNFLTQRYPAVLFYACMLEAMTYLKDDNRIAIFDKLYGTSLGISNTETQENFSDRTVKREEGA